MDNAGRLILQRRKGNGRGRRWEYELARQLDPRSAS